MQVMVKELLKIRDTLCDFHVIYELEKAWGRHLDSKEEEAIKRAIRSASESFLSMHLPYSIGEEQTHQLLHTEYKKTALPLLDLHK